MNSKRAQGCGKALIVTAIFAVLIAGWMGTPALAQNPAGFLGGNYAFADGNANQGGDANERFTLGRMGDNITMAGGGLPGSYTGTLMAPVGAAEATENGGGFNSMYSNYKGRSFWYICTRAVNGECLDNTFLEQPIPTGAGEATTPARHMATFNLMDKNSDGRYESARVAGDTVPTTDLNFVTTSNGGNTFISIPWAMAGVLGVKGNYPQVFIPLSNGKVALDFNGDRIADPGLLSSPALAGAPLAAAIPTLTEWGMIFMTLMMLVGGILMLRRSRVQITLS